MIRQRALEAWLGNAGKAGLGNMLVVRNCNCNCNCTAVVSTSEFAKQGSGLIRYDVQVLVSGVEQIVDSVVCAISKPSLVTILVKCGTVL